ncbi:hypothetical protein EVAR_47467_1 [Eumeta japonica]|uniref:Uncharacterized protein n=1 Tax=Eumeta variegata TaxID=151549 RepID=A0A4C1XEI5_EUMVA|nr:hypothetical protein EVAR_47467_1 [Eumeta japonica]
MRAPCGTITLTAWRGRAETAQRATNVTEQSPTYKPGKIDDFVSHLAGGGAGGAGGAVTRRPTWVAACCAYLEWDAVLSEITYFT